MIREDVREVTSASTETIRERDAAAAERVREDPEAPRAELPEWLAKELFRIFV